MKRAILLTVILIMFTTGLYFLTLRPEPDLITIQPPASPVANQNHYDLIVVGSDPEGIAAAVSGARNDLSTLLVDTRPVLGGLMTLGWLNTIDMNYDPQGHILNQGIFTEFFKQLQGDSFDVATAANVFNQMVENEPNIQVLLGVNDILPMVNRSLDHNSQVQGIVVHTKEQKRKFTAPMIIDATQNGDLAAKAGADFSFGQSDFGHGQRNMAVTLVFQLKGVSRLDWVKLGTSLAYQRQTGTSGVGINAVSAWGFGDVMTKYQPSNHQVGVRGLNMGRQKDGTVLINALHVYDINPLDQAQVEQAFILAKQELPSIVEYIKEHIPGFKKAQLVATAPELYVRESRHLYGEYRLTVDDVLENKDFYDSIAYGSYPIDIQAVNQHFKGAVVGAPQQYGIPLRCLIPQNVEDLMVIGRAASFDSLAHGSARVIPVGMATGQAAAAAAALSAELNITVRELCYDRHHMAQLQRRLNEQGMQLKPFHYLAPETQHWAYPGLKFVRSYGLAFGGYNNDYRLDNEISEQSFINLLSWSTKLAWPKNTKKPQLVTEGKPLTIQSISYMLTRYLDKDIEIKTKDQAYQYLLEKDFYDQQILDHIENNDGKITNGTAYMILKRFIEQ